MRRSPWSLVVIGAVAATGVLGASPPGLASPIEASSGTGCSRELQPGSDPSVRGLPWPVVLDTGCGSFAVFPDGQVMRVDLRPRLEPNPGYRVPAGRGSWAEVQQGHVVFVTGITTVWRSAAAYDPDQLDFAVLGSGWVAFAEWDQEISRLYFAPLGRPERVVALNEGAVAATPWGGLISSRWHSDDGHTDLVTRRADGSLAGVVARDVSFVDAEPSGTVLYQDGSHLMRTDGRQAAPVAETTWVAGAGYVGVTRLGGRIVMTGQDRIEVLRADGRLESDASVSPVAKGGWGYLGVQAQEPGTGAVVFTATRWADANAGGGPGWEGVYLLAPGEHRAKLLYGRRLDIVVCAHSSQVSWHGRWLLYSACEGRVVAIDTTDRLAAIVLHRVARSIPTPEDEGEYGLYNARWAPMAAPSRLHDLARFG